MSTAAVRNVEVVRSAIKLATKANEIGLEAAADLIEKRCKGWELRAVDNGYDRRLARTMVAELEMLAAGIRALKAQG